jgi:tripartite-type tricarboxylate transporter receptor subunit TctC
LSDVFTSSDLSASLAAMPSLSMIGWGVPVGATRPNQSTDTQSGTPQPIIDKLSRAANEALKSDEVTKALQAQTVAAMGGTPEQFRKHMAAEQKRWTGVVNAAGLRK